MQGGALLHCRCRPPWGDPITHYAGWSSTHLYHLWLLNHLLLFVCILGSKSCRIPMATLMLKKKNLMVMTSIIKYYNDRLKYKAKYNRYKCRTPVKVVATETLNPNIILSNFHKNIPDRVHIRLFLCSSGLIIQVF